MSIKYLSADAAFLSSFRRRPFTSLITTLLSQESSKPLDFINFISCSDAYLHTINVQYLQHDTYTDVITFDYSPDSISSDIYVSIERIKENAQSNNVAFLHELHRVLIHGVLHLVGYKDSTLDEINTMRKKEDVYLCMLR